jgi:hypothetical protein
MTLVNIGHAMFGYGDDICLGLAEGLDSNAPPHCLDHVRPRKFAGCRSGWWAGVDQANVVLNRKRLTLHKVSKSCFRPPSPGEHRNRAATLESSRQYLPRDAREVHLFCPVHPHCRSPFDCIEENAGERPEPKTRPSQIIGEANSGCYGEDRTILPGYDLACSTVWTGAGRHCPRFDRQDEAAQTLHAVAGRH